MIIIFASEYAFNKFYNCSFLSNEEWWNEGNPSLLVGIIYLIPGVIFMILYVPIGLSFLNKKLITLTCYKLMFLLFVLDEICLSGCSIFSGIMSIQGAVFCNYPRLMWIFGLLCISIWGSGCCLCVCLGLNRCLDIVNPSINDMLFNGKKFYIWMCFIIIYGFYIGVLNSPMFFSSKTYGWFYDPFYGTNITNLKDPFYYYNYPHVINNFLVVILLAILYSYFCIKITLKYKLTDKLVISNVQKTLLLQSSITCLVQFSASLFYILIQFIPSSPQFVIFTHLTWIFTHGSPVFIYLIFNKQIRKTIFQYFNVFNYNYCKK
uniref:7TM GPCR serpentine receptor class x (Srx) domain-containing protein n=1 Tax=Strongyloides stercoralis TaxID=6248 RepID=A0A0K0EJD9_STRER